MYNVTMKKVLGGKRIRTDEVEGTCPAYPTIGESFAMLAESLSFQGGIRLVTTSMVKNIVKQDDGSLDVETMNSTYNILITET